ncbi:hypothetical protein E4U15_005816 [Claviceps sp. LM218 group G6]|nr:hypothetical protein E4U15_005816 [Claviceps sp. LM218 group G6]
MNTRPFKGRPGVLRWSCAYVSVFLASKHFALRSAAAAGTEYFFGSKQQPAAEGGSSKDLLTGNYDGEVASERHIQMLRSL